MDLVFRKFRNEEKEAASSGKISCVEKLSKDILFGLRKVEIRPGKGTNHLLIHIGEALVKVENNVLSAYDCPEEAKSVEWQIIDEWQYVFSCLEPEKWQRFFARMEFGDHEVAFQMLAELYCCSRENGDVISADASALLILLFSSGCIAGPTFLAHQLIATWLASKDLTLEADAWSLSLSQTQLDRSDFTNLVHKYPTVFSPRKESSKFCLHKEGKETRTLLLAHQFSKLLELAKALLEKQLGVKVCPQGSDNAILIIHIEETVIKVEKELLTINNVSESTRSAEKSIAENWRTLFTDLENGEHDAAFKKLLKLHYSSLVENDLQAFDASSILLLPFSHGCCTTAPKGWPRYLIGSWIAYKGHYEGASEWFTWSKYDAQHIESEPNLYRYHAIICQRMDTAGRNDRKIKESIREPLRAMCNALRAHGRYEQMMQFLFLTDITDLLPRKPVAMHVQTHLRVIITEATEHYRWLLLSEYFMHNQAMLEHAIQMSDIVLHASALYGMGMYYKYFKKFPHAQKIISDLFEATALVSDLNKLAEDRHVVFEATALVLRASICFDIGQIQVSKNDSEKAKKLLEKIPRGALFDQLSDESQRLEACYGADSKSPFDAVKHLLSLDGPKDHHPPSIVAAKENNFLNQIVGQSLSPSLMQKLGSTFKQASQQQLHAEQEESETIVDAFMRLARDTVLEEKWTFDVLEDFLKKEMQIDFGASSNRDRISYFDRRRGEVFGAMQKLMLSRDQVKDAIVWAERERARDLMHGISQLKSGYDPSCAGVFDKSEKDAWDEIKSISKDEGKGIVFIIYSISWRPISYFLHAEDDPQFQFLKPKDIKRQLNEKREEEEEEKEDDIQVIKKKISTVLELIKEEKEDELKVNLEYMYKLLIDPWNENLERINPRHIVIIPHQELSTLPFAALGKPSEDDDSEDDDSEDDKDFTYLIQRYALTCTPSMRLFRNCKRRCHEKYPTKALVVGNPITEGYKLLQSAEKEATFVSKILKKAGFSYVRVLQGKEARKEQVSDHTFLSFDWIHIASHAIIEQQFPTGALVLSSTQDSSHSTMSKDRAAALERALERAKTEADRSMLKSLSDHLTTEEIESYGELNAMVAVLSACGSGLGETYLEGVVGLSRSLHMTGVSNTVVSLWNLKDAVALEFMILFYTNLKSKEIAIALQETMKSMIEKEDKAGRNVYNVKCWAPFMLTGIPTTRMSKPEPSIPEPC